ncbi:MAG: hypothetical protein ACRD4G_04550 [Bryobacteraceae bacterium]
MRKQCPRTARSLGSFQAPGKKGSLATGKFDAQGFHEFTSDGSSW